MIVNQNELLVAAPIKDMFSEKKREHGVSYGLAEAGYDIRIKQNVTFRPHMSAYANAYTYEDTIMAQRFTLASAIEEFQMPDDLVGRVCDKSTWARHGLSVFNTVIEPGWNGFLTLELVYHGSKSLHIPAGAGIAQILFSRIQVQNAYSGKYQNQADEPVAAVYES